MKKILFTLALMAGVGGAFGQVTVGSGTATGQAIPVECYYGYTYSQVIYSAASINASGTITALKFNKSGTGFSNSNDWTVYMGHTTNSDFATNSSWIPTTSMTQVFTGTLTQVGTEVEVILTTPFVYNGTDNIVIAVDENATSYDGSSDDFYCTATGSNTALTYYNDSTDPDPTSPPTSGANLRQYIANVTFVGITQSCPTLTGLSASNITSSSADLAWTAGTAASSQVEYGTAGFTLGTGTSSIVSTNAEFLTGLTPVTDYEFYVRDICAPGDTAAWAGPFAFSTLCGTYSPTYTEDFASYIPTCWSEMQGVLGATNTTVTNATSSNWTSDGFGNNGFSGAARMEIYSTGRDEWLISPTIDLGTGSVAYQVEFDVALTNWSSTAAATFGADDTLAVVISTDNGVTWNTTNILQSWVAGSEPSNTGDFIAIDVSMYTGLVQFGFYAASSVSGGDINVYIDNFKVQPIPSCSQPLGLSVDAVSTTSADVSWTQGATDSYVEYGPAGFTQGTGTIMASNTGMATLSGLTPVTDYEFYVMDSCGVGNLSSWTGPVSFTTDCPNYVPTYTQDFASYIPDCWSEMQGVLGATNTTITNTTSSNWGVDGFANVGTTGSAKINLYSTGRDEWLVSPTIDLGTGSTAYQVEFDIALTDYASTAATTLGVDDTIAIVISTDNGVTWNTANILQSWVAGSEPSNTGDYIAIDISAYTGLVKFGFYAASSVSNADNDVFVDNFSVLPIPTCPKPTNLSISNLAYNGVDISWTGGAANVQIEYGAPGFALGTGTSILTSSNPHNITGLTEQTGYEFYIRDICAVGDTSLWSGPVAFTTPCAPVVPVYTEVFGSYIPSCWSEMQGVLGAANTTITNTSSSSWTTDVFGNTGADDAARINLYGTGRDEWLVSPTVDLGNGTTDYHLEFNVALTDYNSTAATTLGSDDTLAVVISTDNGVTWNTANILQSWTAGNEPSNTGDYVGINLAGYTGLVKFGFYAASSASNADNDVFIDNFEINICTPSSSTITEVACDSYISPSGMAYSASGTYMDTIPNAIGCDSVITINLTVNNSTTSMINVTECSMYTAPSGAMYSTAGTHYDTIPNAAGCDSIITINLTLNNTANTLTEVACDSYVSPSGVTYTTSGTYMDTIANTAGCDSIITINLTVNASYETTVAVVACDTFVSPDGIQYTATGMYTEIFTNIGGCDSTINYDVTINDSYANTVDVAGCFEYVSAGNVTYTTSGTYTESYQTVEGCDSIITLNVDITSIDLTVTQVNGVELTSNETDPSATYQWVDCNDNNAPISGATSNTYTATANGSYACEVTKNSCTEISECKIVTNVGVNDEAANAVSIYPNPNQGNFIVEMASFDEQTEIIIRNAAGQIVYRDYVTATKNVINISDVETGIYIVNIQSADQSTQKMLVIE